MSASFNYIEQPKSKSYCRLCNKSYNEKNSLEGRFKIFKEKKDCGSISQRLSAVGLLVDDDPSLSETICRTCERKIKKIEEARRFKDEWVGVKRKIHDNNNEEPSTKKQKIQNNNDSIQQVGKYIWNYK